MSQKQIIKIPAKLEGVSPLANDLISLRFKAEAVSDEQKVAVMRNIKATGWLLFSIDEIGEEEAPEKDSEFGNRKSYSQRLRGVLFVVYREIGIKGEFEDFYKEKMEEAIDFWKKQLPPQ